MAFLKFKIHPLFFVFGLYFALTGKVFSFLIFTLVALEHELGHFFASQKLGYKLDTITLLPYGAIIKGDLTGLKYKDECSIAIAGPLINIYTALLFVALWWIFPALYTYTDIIVFASVSLAVINLLPCYPLDGGRFLYATLSIYFSRKTAKLVVNTLGVVLSLLLLGLFIYSLFTTPNITILFFSLFMLVGVFGGKTENSYIKTYSSFNLNNDKKPKEIKSFYVNENAIIKDLFLVFDNNYYYQIKLKVDDKTITIENDELIAILSEENIYLPIKESKIVKKQRH